MPFYIEILNNGPDISKTNYFDSEYAKNGYFYLSTNEDCVRLLVPGSEAKTVKENRKDTEYIILSRGPWFKRNIEDSVEILFENQCTKRSAIHLPATACDGLPGEGGVWCFALYLKAGKKFECPLFFRKVIKVPCLLPLDYSSQPFVLSPVADAAYLS